MTWQVKTIDQLGKVVTGKTPSTKNRAMYDGNYMFVTPTDLDWQSYYVRSTHSTVTDLAREKHKNQFIPANSTVFTCIGNTIGKCGLTTEDCISNQQINTVVPNDEHDSKFVYYLLNHNRPKIRSIGLSGGAAQPIINKSTFSAIKVLTPDTKIEEEKISSVLSAYDDLIENNRRRIALLEEAVRLLYREWFVHFRFPGHEHVKIIDGVSEGWERKTFADVCETIGGGTPSTKVPEYWNDADITWITPTDITRNNCLAILDGEKKISQTGLKKSSAKLVPPYTILMTSRASVGFFGLIDREVCTNQGFINIIPNIEAYRYYLLFNLIHRVEEIRSHAGGSTYAEISKRKFKALPVAIPAVDLLKDFDEIVRPVLDQVRVIKKESDALAKARDLLLPRLMDGRIGV